MTIGAAPPGSGDFSSQRRQPVSPARRQGNAMAIGRKNPRKFCTDARRSARYQRYTLGHDFNTLKSMGRTGSQQ